MIIDYSESLFAIVEKNGEVLMLGRTIFKDVKSRIVHIKSVHVQELIVKHVQGKNVERKYTLGISIYYMEMVEKTIKMDI